MMKQQARANFTSFAPLCFSQHEDKQPFSKGHFDNHAAHAFHESRILNLRVLLSPASVGKNSSVFNSARSYIFFLKPLVLGA